MNSFLTRVRQKLPYILGPDAKLLRKVRSHTLLSPGKLKNLKHLANVVRLHGVEGDFVECGIYRGGSAAVIATALTPGRHLWLYDSFEGMPDVREIDGEAAKEWVGKCAASEEDVIKVFTSIGLPSTRYTIRKGWFDQTFQQPLPNHVAFLHCDADWYNSVSLVLETFYPLVSEGGCVILDDFGCWEGCREAFYNFCYKHGEKPLLERLEYDQAYWIKGKTHNREFLSLS